jgi:formylglycine-generating enzyme required for sulfatase activity
MNRSEKRRAVTLCGMLLAAGVACANSLQVTNVVVSKRDDHTAYVNFDIAWQNSWRYTNVNHDAAWVVFKVRQEGGTEWQHVNLEYTGINPSAYSNGVGTAVDLIVPSDGVGLIVRRASEGFGTLAVTNVQAVWHIPSGTLVKSGKLFMRALAMEMVYVAEGAFKVGSGGTETGSLTDGSWTNGVTIPFQITSEAALTITQTAGCLWGTKTDNNSTFGGTGTLSADFPKGYAAFYCMKTEASQGQYVDFLNTLTAVQATNRYSSTAWNRYTLSVSGGSYSASVPDRICNGLCYADAAAFMDWAGLRPMTELEFEKACRGPLDPVANEFVWGTTAIGRTTGIVNDNLGTAVATNGNCNCQVYGANASPYGPFRAGIYATSTSTREAAGASYWGILDLGGSLWEYVLTLGRAEGRAFTGLHGDGKLTADGAANVASWPSVTTAVGIGFRGGSYQDSQDLTRISARNYCGAYADPSRNNLCCCRGARTAPAGVQP